MTTEPDGPWASEEACCFFCGHEWVSVHPCVEELECPNCHRMTKSTTAIERDEWLKRDLGHCSPLDSRMDEPYNIVTV